MLTATSGPPESDAEAGLPGLCDHGVLSSSRTFWRNDCLVKGVSRRNQEIGERCRVNIPQVKACASWSCGPFCHLWSSSCLFPLSFSSSSHVAELQLPVTPLANSAVSPSPNPWSFQLQPTLLLVSWAASCEPSECGRAPSVK